MLCNSLVTHALLGPMCRAMPSIYPGHHQRQVSEVWSHLKVWDLNGPAPNVRHVRNPKNGISGAPFARPFIHIKRPGDTDILVPDLRFSQVEGNGKLPVVHIFSKGDGVEGRPIKDWYAACQDSLRQSPTRLSQRSICYPLQSYKKFFALRRMHELWCD